MMDVGMSINMLFYRGLMEHWDLMHNRRRVERGS